jgi:hypothetical protein
MEAKAPVDLPTSSPNSVVKALIDEALGDQVDDEARHCHPPKGKTPNLRLELKQRKGEKGNS